MKEFYYRTFDSRDKGSTKFAFSFVLAAIGLLLFMCVTGGINVAYADGFTDIFKTNSFRGSFEWLSKLDVLGIIVQGAISIFSIVGVSMIMIRIMTSLLYLSARGLWEEVHELKTSGGDDGKFWGIGGMAKTWFSGKSGTGLDAIIGAALVLLIDVKEYSDFGEKSGQKFDQDTTMTQYILKIALPTVMAVFFLAMGFNGTLAKGIATSVDALGAIADHAVSVNFAGFVDDAVNSFSGYKFIFAEDGTKKGELQQSIARELYGKVVAKVDNPTDAQLEAIGISVEEAVKSAFGDGAGNIQVNGSILEANKNQIAGSVYEALTGNSDGGRAVDEYYGYLSPSVVQSTSSVANGCSVELNDLLSSAGLTGDGSVKFYMYLRSNNTSGTSAVWQTNENG